jgi:hypothetical protein
MLFFLIIVMILGTGFPIINDSDGVFFGWKVLFSKGVIIPVISAVLIVFALFFCLWLYTWNKGSRLGVVTETKYENVSIDVMSFVASYFFPLVSFNLGTTWRHIVVLAMLFVIIGVIYVKSNIYYCNPTLLLLGFRTYKVQGTYSGNKDFKNTIIVWGRMNDGDKFKYIPIDQNTSFAFKI